MVLFAALLGVLAFAGGAAARVLLVADGTPQLPLVELSSDSVVAQIAMPAAVSAVAVSALNGKGYAAAGNAIVEIDIDQRVEIRRVVLPGAPVSQLATTRDGRLLALQGDVVTLLDPAGLTATASIALGGVGQHLAAGRRSGDGAVVLAGGRVAVLDLDAARLVRTVAVPGAIGVAIDGAGRTWVTAGRFLRVIAPDARKASRSRVKLPPGAGGAVALSPRDARLAIGPVAGSSTGAIVNLSTRTLRPLRTGPGPGTPSWNLDATRIYYADGGGDSVSIVGASNRRRLSAVALADAASR